MSKNFKVKNGLEVTTNVTASGDISSSGTITMLTASIGGGIFTSASLAAGGGGGSMDNFTLTADGGSNQTIADGNTLDIAGGDGITTAVGATDTVTVNVDASQDGHISSILTTDLKLGEDAQTKIDFETNNEIHFDVNNAELFNMTGNQLSGSGVSTGSFGRVDATSLPNIGYANFTGSVGIGTTSPGEKLEVIGNISSSGKITGDDFEFNLPTNNARKFKGSSNEGVRLHATTGGWAMEYGFFGNDGRDLGGFGAFGGNPLEYFYVGNHYQRAVMTIHSGSTNGVMIGSGIGETNPPKTLTVAGEISASGNITTPSTGSVGNLIATTIEGTLSDSSRTDINSILATDLVLGEDAQTKIDFGTANIIKFFANNSEKMTISDTGVVIDGDITAQQYIVNSTVTNVTQSFSSGSTIFGDTPADDTHQFTGSVSVTGSFTANTVDINGGTLDGITSLTAGGDLDIGAHDLRAATLTADGLTNTRVVFAGSNGVLSDNSKFTFASNKLSTPSLSVSQSSAGGIGISIEQPTTALVTARFDSDRFRFWAGGSERLTILSASGHVGIGNASPAKELTVNGEISASGNITTPSTGSVGNLIATTLEGTLADSSRTDINSILATDLVLGEDAQTKIDFETANEIHFDINNSELFNMTGNELSGSDSSTGSFASLNVRGSVQDNLTVDGTLFATKKSFLIPRPEGGKLEYGVLEGQQNDVFFRGELKGDNVIYLPQEWEWLVDDNTITVQLTSIGNYQELFVKEIKDNKIFIHMNGAFKTKKDIHCYHIIHGTRKDVELIRNYQ